MPPIYWKSASVICSDCRIDFYTLQKRIASVGSVQGGRGRGQSQLEEENTLLRQQVSLRATVEYLLFGLHHVLIGLVLCC